MKMFYFKVIVAFLWGGANLYWIDLLAQEYASCFLPRNHPEAASPIHTYLVFLTNISVMTAQQQTGEKLQQSKRHKICAWILKSFVSLSFKT